MYIYRMSKQYSIADARKKLPTVIDEAEAGAEVELTRRGKPVAVVISVEEYQRLKTKRVAFGEAYARFRIAYPSGTGGIGPEYFAGLRDRGPGRPIDL